VTISSFLSRLILVFQDLRIVESVIDFPSLQLAGQCDIFKQPRSQKTTAADGLFSATDNFSTFVLSAGQISADNRGQTSR